MVITNNGFLVKYTGKDSEITIPQEVVYIAPYVFKNNTYLKRVILPDNITSIAAGTFSNCSNLKEILLPTKLTNIEFGAFSGCVSLTQLDFSKNTALVSIGENAFANSGLETVVLPRNLTTLGKSAFYNCNRLVEVWLSSKLNSVETYTFAWSTNLTKIHIPSTITKIDERAFSAWGGKKDQTIYCELNSYAYRYALENGYKTATE
jgi:hypothetical protein